MENTIIRITEVEEWKRGSKKDIEERKERRKREEEEKRNNIN